MTASILTVDDSASLRMAIRIALTGAGYAVTEAKVAVAPGVGYGENGEGYVRIALVENEQRLRQAARNVKRYLQSMGVNTPAQGAG